MDKKIDTYHLEKPIWTEQDFDQMGWHDSHIHAISFGEGFQFKLDIDYIFEWVHPKVNETYFNFWIAPCTLVFENVWDLRLDILISSDIELEIDDLRRENAREARNAAYIEKKTEYDWTIETHQGDITFKSVGYIQYVRMRPVLTSSQVLLSEVRGGISFSKESV